MQNGEPVAVQVQHGVVVEQPPVEVADRVLAEIVALGHGVEELPDLLVEALRVVAATVHQAGEQFTGQQVNVFGKEAEQQANQVMGDGRGA